MQTHKFSLPSYFTIVSFITGMLVLVGAIGITTNGLHLLVPAASVIGSRETLESVRQGLLEKLVDSIGILIVGIPLFWFHFRFVLRQWKKQHSEK